jgi:hypothetical protein
MNRLAAGFGAAFLPNTLVYATTAAELSPEQPIRDDLISVTRQIRGL